MNRTRYITGLIWINSQFVHVNGPPDADAMQRVVWIVWKRLRFKGPDQSTSARWKEKFIKAVQLFEMPSLDIGSENAAAQKRCSICICLIGTTHDKHSVLNSNGISSKNASAAHVQREFGLWANSFVCMCEIGAFKAQNTNKALPETAGVVQLGTPRRTSNVCSVWLDDMGDVACSYSHECHCLELEHGFCCTLRSIGILRWACVEQSMYHNVFTMPPNDLKVHLQMLGPTVYVVLVSQLDLTSFSLDKWMSESMTLHQICRCISLIMSDYARRSIQTQNLIKSIMWIN